MDRALIQTMITRGAVADLRRVNPADVTGYLNALLRENEVPDGSADVDRLHSNGVALARAGFDELDSAAVGWFSEKPSPERLDAVAAFLDGFWSDLPRLNGDHNRSIGEFIACAESLRSSAEIEYGYLRSLAAALRSDVPSATQERIRSILLSAPAKDFGPALQPLVTSLADRARRTMPEPM